MWPRTPLSPRPVTVKTQLIQICTWIDSQYCQPRGGVCEGLESTSKIWQEILESGDKPKVLVCCTGEKNRGPFSEQDLLRRVDRQWTLALVRGEGFRDLLPQADGDPPNSVEDLTTSIETVRDLVRRMTGVSEEFPINYKGWEQFDNIAKPNTANVFITGAWLHFSTANDLPGISE